MKVSEASKKVDLIDRQAAIDAIRTKYCPSDFMDDGVIDAFAEIIQDLPSAQPLLNQGQPRSQSNDYISRRAAIDALWKALFEYEDKTEKQFVESDELDVSDWIQHRIFIQNMSDIDRQTILYLPSAQPSDEYERGWKEGREALREETWEYVRDRFD